MAPYTSGQAPAQGGAAGGNPSAAKSGIPVWLIVLLVVLVMIVAIVAILGVLAVVGVRKYLSAAKTAEALNGVNQIALDADRVYAEDGKLCESASSPVPASITQVSGKKYLSAVSDWEVDKSKHAGFDCLKFTMEAPQYYQYDYKKTPTGFVAFARGDLDGNGVASEFSKSGKLMGTSLVLDTEVTQKNPTE